MLVVHGVWSYGALHVWAESGELPHEAPPRAGRPSRAPRSHPFALPAGLVADALPDIARKAVDDELTLRLPTVGDAPYPSPELGREPPTGRPALASWRVPALVFDPATAVPLLNALASPDQPASVGVTITYLTAVAVFAAPITIANLGIAVVAIFLAHERVWILPQLVANSRIILEKVL